MAVDGMASSPGGGEHGPWSFVDRVKANVGLVAVRSPWFTSIGSEDRRVSAMKGTKRCKPGAPGVPGGCCV